MGDDSRRLFVGQLPSDILEEEVLTVFRTYGEVSEVKVIDSKPPATGKCAFVIYETERAAKAAIQVLNDVYKFRHESENPVRVSVARGRGPAGGRRDDDRGAAQGGSGSGSGSAPGRQAWDEEDTRKVFVGQLPMDIREDEIQQIFGTYGKVADVKIIEGKPVGTQKCAFVCYEAESGAKAAVQVLHEVYKFRVEAEKPIRVEFVRGKDKESSQGGSNGGGGGGGGREWTAGSRDWSNDRGGGSGGDWAGNRGTSERQEDHALKCFVGNLPMDIQEDEVRMIFGTYGTVTDVKIIDSKSGGSSRCGFVHYESEAGAKAAIQVLHNVYKFRLDSEHPIRVEASKGKAEREDRNSGNDGWRGNEGSWDRGSWDRGSSDRGSSDVRRSSSSADDDGRKLFVGQLPMDITQEEVTELFKIYGDVQGVHIIDGKPVGSNKVAFIEFGTPESSQAALEALNEQHKFRIDSEKPITIRIARPKSQMGGGGGGGRNDRWNDWDNKGWGNKSWDKGGWGRDDRNDRYNDWNKRDDWKRSNDYKDDRGGNPQDRPVGPKLHIGNLPTDINREALEQVFSTYGALTDVHIMNNNSSNGGQCAAFVTYGIESDARKAVAAMETGYEIRPGQGNINVTFAKVKNSGGYRSRPY